MAFEPYAWYDTALFGTALVTHTLFTQPEGSATDKQSEDTNMRIGGQFAQGSTFQLDAIYTFIDDNLVIADVVSMWQQSFFKLIVDNKILLQLPLRMTAKFNSYGGAFHETTDTALEVIGVQGLGLELRKSIIIDGGQQIKVELVQGTVLANAGQRVKMILDGLFDDAR